MTDDVTDAGRPRWRQTVAALALDPQWEWLRVAALLPFLMFPTVLRGVTIALVGGWVVLTIVASTRGAPLWVRTPLSWPLALLGATVLMGVAVTPFRDLALPKLAGVALGILALRALLFVAVDPRTIWRAVVAYVGLGCALVALGAVTTAWFEKFPIVARVRIPQVIAHLPGTAPEGVQPNALGALQYTSTAPRKGECSLACHGKDHDRLGY